MIDVIFYMILLVILFFIPGFGLINFWFKRRTALVLSPGVSVLLFVLYFFVVNDIIFYLVFTGLFLIGIKKLYEWQKNGWNYKLIALGTVSIFLYLIIALIIPYPTPGGDWFYHSIEYTEMVSNGQLPKERPVLFNVLIFSVHEFLNIPLSGFWLTQLVCIILGLSVILPSHLVAEKISSKYKYYILLLIVLSPAIVMNSIYTWPKALAAYFVLIALYFLVFEKGMSKQNKWVILAGVFMGLGFLAHNYVGFFILSVVLFFVLKKQLKNILMFLIVVGLVTAPYFYAYYSQYGSFSESSFKLYPFAVKGYAHAVEHPEEVMDSFEEAGLLKIFGIRFQNIILTTTPALSAVPIFGKFLGYTNDTIQWSFWLSMFHTYFGALGIGVYILLTAWLIKFQKTDEEKNTFFFILTLVLFNALFWGWRKYGSVHHTLQPTVPLLIIFGMRYFRDNFDKRILFLVVGASLMGFLMFVYLTNAYFWTHNESYNIYKNVIVSLYDKVLS